MKTISLWALVFTLASGAVQAQSSATQQQLDALSGRVQDLIDAQALQGKRLDALDREISELRDKVNTPQVNDSASRDDLKKLVEQVQEIDRKRQADKELILKNLEQLGKVSGEAAARARKAAATPKAAEDTAAPATPQKGYDYVVQKGDSISAIAKAYRDQGVKVTTTQIIKANPGLTAGTLFVGKKIFIPDPNAK